MKHAWGNEKCLQNCSRKNFGKRRRRRWENNKKKKVLEERVWSGKLD